MGADMDRAEAARVLGVDASTTWAEVRRTFREQIRRRHPDRAGAGGVPDAVRIIEAYRVLARAQLKPEPHRPAPPSPPADVAAPGWSTDSGISLSVARISNDTLAFGAPADETLRWLLEAAHDIGEVTYLDRSVPIVEILCKFVGEPATSLVITLQGRSHGTEAFCTAESIEARPAPLTSAVVDVLEAALMERAAAVGATVDRTGQPP